MKLSFILRTTGLLGATIALGVLIFINVFDLLHEQEAISNLFIAIKTSLSRLADGLTIGLIVFLLCIELVILVLTQLAIRRQSLSLPAEAHTYKAMRPAIFLFLFGIDLSMSFLPLHMGTLYEPMFGLSKDVVMGLPISVEFLCVGIALFWSGVWLDRRGWQEPFLYGVLLATAGGLYSWLAPDALHFILSRALVGFGYGLTLLAAQGFVIRHTDARNKARGLAHLFAGLYSGSICGAAAGAMLAERFGYEMVFLSGALMMFGVIAYLFLFMPNSMEKGPPVTTRAPAYTTHSTTVSRFLLDRQVIAVVFFSSLPASIAVVGFLNYFSPVYLSRGGASESTIGQVLMLFGICLTLLGPTIGRWVDAWENKKLPIVIGGLLGSLAFLTFNLLQGVAAVTFAVVLLGLSNCLVLSSQSAYVLRLKVTRDLGEGKAMGIFRATSRIGQMLGPILFAWLIVVTDIQDGVIYFGLAYLVVALLFPLLAGSEAKIVDKSHVTERTA